MVYGANGCLHPIYEDLISQSVGMEGGRGRGDGGLDEPTRDVCGGYGGGGKMSRLLEISARRPPLPLPPLRTSATRAAWYFIMVWNTGFVSLHEVRFDITFLSILGMYQRR